MRIIRDKISIQELKKIVEETFGNLVKAAVDVEREIMAVGGELYSDEESLLLENGSRQHNLWGINLYTDIEGEDWLEFNSVINIRPSQRNLSRSVDNPQMRERIIEIVNKLVKG